MHVGDEKHLSNNLKRQVGRPRYRWKGTIKMNLKEVGCELDTGSSVQSPLADSCAPGNKPPGSIMGGEFLGQLTDCQLLKKASCSRIGYYYS
jgi:hypothetical protein